MLLSNSDAVSRVKFVKFVKSNLLFVCLQFLSEMSKLFSANQTNGGSIYITMKRIDNRKKPTPRPSKTPLETKPLEYMCLIRVQNNKRKISTIVSSKDVNKFQQVKENFEILAHTNTLILIHLPVGLLKSAQGQSLWSKEEGEKEEYEKVESNTIKEKVFVFVYFFCRILWKSMFNKYQI